MSVVLTNATILLGGYDVSGQHNQVSLDLSANMLDATVFGDTNRKYKSGLKTARLTGSGFWGSTADQGISDNLGVNDVVVSVYPETIIEGSTSSGLGYAFLAVEATYQNTLRIGELMAFSVTAEGRGV